MKSILGLVCAATFMLSSCNSGGNSAVVNTNKDISAKVIYSYTSPQQMQNTEIYALQMINQHIVSSFNLNHSPILMNDKSSNLYYDCQYQLGKTRGTSDAGQMMVELYSRHVANCGEYSTLGALTVMHDLLIGGKNTINSNFQYAYVGHSVPGDHAFALVLGKSGQLYILDPMFQMVKPIQQGNNGLLVRNYWKIDGVFFQENSVIAADHGLTSKLTGALLHNQQLLKLMEREAIKYARKIHGLSILSDTAIDNDYQLDQEPRSISSILMN